MKLPLRILSFTVIWTVRAFFAACVLLLVPLWGPVVLVYGLFALLLYVACDWKPKW